MTDTNALEAVYRHPLFKNDALEKIFAAHELVHFSKGDYLLKEQKIANEYFILQSGLARSFVYDYTGNDITTSFFGEKEIIIEVSSLFQRVPSQENIQALTDCCCWRIGFQDFQQLFHSIESFREWGRSWMAEQLFLSKQRSVEMITTSAKERYLKLMNEKPRVLQLAPLKQIATYLDITDSSLSRIRKELSDKD